MESHVDAGLTADRPATLAHIGTAVKPSRNDDEWHLGHMWLFWNESQQGSLDSRGYYPDVSVVPDAYLTNNGLRRYLITNRVPGCYMRDSVEMNNLDQRCLSGEVRQKVWAQTGTAIDRLEAKCPIPLGEKIVQQGDYSCNEDFSDTENCCSWAISVINYATQQVLIRCDRPKRLGRVEEAIWGAKNLA